MSVLCLWGQKAALACFMKAVTLAEKDGAVNSSPKQSFSRGEEENLVAMKPMV